ncbi:AI-2E family transporter [Bacillus massiliigorillae]|uniref:AI-2E family transporter n=1 Tax=Bacillus massiliigorillae TaxID=1243664 RepID=UPI00039A9750|nr:AI-2E family transporter [Bacillus massiliigorillae]
MSKDKFKSWTIQILIILTIVFLCTQLSFLLKPVGVFFSTLFMPLLISGFLFFIFNPVVKLFQKKLKLNRSLSILLLYVIIFAAIGFSIANIVPIITKQITSFVNDLPTYAKQMEVFIDKMSHSAELKNFLANDYVPLETLQGKLTDFLNTLPNKITNSAIGFFGFITSATITIVTVPILLFYMFKDGHKLPGALSKFIPINYRSEGLVIIKDVGNTLSAYINGQVTVACFVGFLSLIGYWIVDVPYALLMALIVAVTNIIPYVGPILGGAPAVIIALFDSPVQALLVVVVIVIAQQLEGNLLSPLILGKSLDIHPATVIILLLVAGNIAGVLGMVLAVPTYAVSKTIVVSIIKFLNARKRFKAET